MNPKISINNYIVLTLIVLFSVLGLKAEQLYTVNSGDWFNPAVWSGGKVPTSSDDVQIKNGHTIYLFGIFAPVAELNLCRKLSIEYKAILITGHNNSTIITNILLNGDMHCDGVYYQGDTNTVNPNLKFNIENKNVLISGNGYLKAKDIYFDITTPDNFVKYEHQYTVCENDFYINSYYPTKLDIETNAYIYIMGNFGITGKDQHSMMKTTSVDCSIKGVVVAKNVWLLTPAEATIGSTLSLTHNSAITASSFNNSDTTLRNTAVSFQLFLKDEATLRLAKGSNNPLDLMNSDLNLNIKIQQDARITGLDLLQFPSSTSLLLNIKNLKPINSDKIENSFANVYSASHIAGWYNFTDQPYLKEGVDAMKQFGTTNIKLAFSIVKNKSFETYPFNHTWADYSDLVKLAQDPYWVEIFNDPHYKTYTIWVSTRTMNGSNSYKQGAHKGNDKYWDEETQFYNFAKHLLVTYPDKEFVFQNWEGDWMLRGSGVLWENDPSLIPANIEIMLEGMRRMFMVRQRGVERARNEVAGTGRVMLAVEANKLFAYKDGEYKSMMKLNTPSLVADVFPHMKLDMVSWSSYDGIWFNRETEFPIGLNNGIDIFASYINPTGYNLKNPVMLGEIGFNENLPYRPSGLTNGLLNDYYERLAALARYKNIFAYYLWNLYCSGDQNITLEKGVQYTASFLTPYMDGKWVIKPDGSLGFSGQKFISFKNKLIPPFTTINVNEVSKKITFNNRSILIKPELLNRQFTIFNVAGVPLLKFSGKSIVDISNLRQGIYLINSTDNLIDIIAIKFVKH